MGKKYSQKATPTLERKDFKNTQTKSYKDQSECTSSDVSLELGLYLITQKLAKLA